MHTYWTSMFWSIDSCQNRVPADQYHLTISPAQVSTHREFLKLSADTLLVFKWSRAQVQFFFKFIWNMLCLCAAQLKFWLQTDLGCENSTSCYRQGRQLLLTFPTMVTGWSRSAFQFYALIGQNLTDEFTEAILALLDTFQELHLEW